MHKSASNPHNITKSAIGLGNVDNTSDATKHVAHANSAAQLDGISIWKNNNYSGGSLMCVKNVYHENGKSWSNTFWFINGLKIVFGNQYFDSAIDTHETIIRTIVFKYPFKSKGYFFSVSARNFNIREISIDIRVIATYTYNNIVELDIINNSNYNIENIHVSYLAIGY